MWLSGRVPAWLMEGPGSRQRQKAKAKQNKTTTHTQILNQIIWEQKRVEDEWGRLWLHFVIKMKVVYLIYSLVINTFGILIMCMCACTHVSHGTCAEVTGHLSEVGSLSPPWVLRMKLRSLCLGLHLCGNNTGPSRQPKDSYLVYYILAGKPWGGA